MKRATTPDLLFVSKGTKERLDLLAAGESLARRTNYTIRELRLKAAEDRINLSHALLRDARRALQAEPPQFRTAVGRAYYSMYHAIRASSFITHGGDDHEQHTVLPSKIPNDFPDRALWENDLKSARLERNRADYDPYPKQDDAFESAATKVLEDADRLFPLARAYVRQKA